VNKELLLLVALLKKGWPKFKNSTIGFGAKDGKISQKE
jgi:hypothetical protein